MDSVILIVSDMDDDLHAAVIKSELEKRGETVVCFNPADVICGRVEFSIGNDVRPECRIRGNEFDIHAGSIKSVLYRRPSPVPEHMGVEEDYRAVVRNEWISLIEGFWEQLSESGCLWVSHPSNIKRAESKLRQLTVARKLGMRIPRTMVTNDIQCAQRFFTEIQKSVVVKKLRSHCIAVGDHTALFVAKLLDDPGELAADDLRLCPVILQEYMAKVCDVRLVVIGETAFAVKIDSQVNESTRIDYRAGIEQTQQLAHFLYEAPKEIVNACRTMMGHFGIAFGAFDFVILPSGEHVFLELNPNGQWLWLQLATKARLTDAFCDLLSHNHPDRFDSSQFSPHDSD
jgi:glutathione synthase/RimK-type ligase-like ATP-grasp enzyme